MAEGTQLIRGLEGVVAAETELCDLDGTNGRLAYRSLAPVDRDCVDAESWSAMTETRARDKLADGRSGAQESMARHPWHRLDERRGGQLGDRPNRCGDVRKSLEIMVNHGRDNKRVKERVDG